MFLPYFPSKYPIRSCEYFIVASVLARPLPQQQEIHFELSDAPASAIPRRDFNNRSIHFAAGCTREDRFYYSENFGRYGTSREIRSYALGETRCGVNSGVSCPWTRAISRASSAPPREWATGERVSKFYREEASEKRARARARTRIERNGSIDL